MKKIHKSALWIVAGVALMALDVKNPAPDLFSNLFGTGATAKSIFSQIVDILIWFSGLIAMAYIIIGGYQYMTSAGNEDAADKGKKTLTNAIIGLVIIIMSYVIIRIVVGTLGGK